MKIIDDLVNKGKLKHVQLNDKMVKKEFEIGKKDYASAVASFEAGNFKWATIQAYYAIFHAMRALLYKHNYREKSHVALKLSIKELFINNKKLPRSVYDTLERGMELREMADYKESYSQNSAENIILAINQAIMEIEKIL
ncbi:MAG: HEPN domain-containing protein [Clostridia bacterium]|nr:HEPN domain-containing protein [Clostridia bacterium]